MKILFQGDSITDVGRGRDDDQNLGGGYPLLIKANLGFEEPEKHEYVNRGISGNRIVDLYARMKADILNLKPDVMSILIGVNDVWHGFSENPNGVDGEKFFRIYDMLISEIKEELPNIKIMIMEPFLMKAEHIEGYYDEFKKEVEIRAQKAKEIADKHNLTFIPLQKGFDELCNKASVYNWTGDGVHPTCMGHEYIKREWIKAFKAL